MPARKKEDSALVGRAGRSDERHTAGPWRKSGTLVCDQHGNKVADCFTNQLDGLCDEGNAAFIVRAANCHDDLLEALRAMRAALKVALDSTQLGNGDAGRLILEADCAAVAAIKKAEA